ncbi:MAG: hypothetical protein ACPGGK_12960, partial [Pikeienuella sp.]
AATTNTLTNKTFDANGTGNSLSNVDVADLADGTDGELITWDASGNPDTVAVGTSGHVLTSNGAGAAPTFQAAAGGSGDAWGDAVDADVVPDGDGTRDLGSTGTRFAQSYVDQSYVTEGFIVTEAADHPVTPSAGIGQFWVSNAATQQPMFTDDAGTDRTLLTDDGTALGAVAMASGDTIIIADSSDSDNLKETTQAQFITQMNMAVLGANTFTGTQDFNGQQVEGMLNKVVASVTGTLTTTAHSGNVLETSGNVTVPTTAGFNCVLIAGGAHTVTFNSTTSAAMAAGDLMTLIVEDATTIHAVLTAAADKVTFS